MVVKEAKFLFENGKTYLSSVMSVANVRNRNDRIYPDKHLKRATIQLSEKVAKEIVYSELEHPNYLESNIIKENTCGVLTEVTWQDSDNSAYCKVEILENLKAGKEIINNLKEGINYGVSTRGAGTLNEDNIVQDDLVFGTVDIVTFPSCNMCYVKINESLSNNTTDFLIESEKECDCLDKLSEDDLEQIREVFVESFKKLIK